MLMEELGEIDEYYGMRKQANPPPFLVKTYMLVEDPSTDDAVSWNSDGTSFVVWQPAEFARDLLPTLFKHSNFSSFIRQLNTYGFRKVATSRWEFCNDKFQKGKRELLCLIRRRKAWAANRAHPSPPPSTSEVEMGPPIRSSSISSSSTSEQNNNNNNNNMVEENKRLKRENGKLTSELSNVKSKCKELMELVAAYKATSTSSDVAVRTNLGGEEEDQRVKLFGVRLDACVKGEYDEDGERKKKRKTSASSDARYIHHLPQSCKY